MPTKYEGHPTTLSAVFSTKTFIFHEIRGILPSGSPRLPLFFEPGKSIFDLKTVGSPPPGGVERSYGTWSLPKYTFLHFGTGFGAREEHWKK